MVYLHVHVHCTCIFTLLCTCTCTCTLPSLTIYPSLSPSLPSSTGAITNRPARSQRGQEPLPDDWTVSYLVLRPYRAFLAIKQFVLPPFTVSTPLPLFLPGPSQRSPSPLLPRETRCWQSWTASDRCWRKSGPTRWERTSSVASMTSPLSRRHPSIVYTESHGEHANASTDSCFVAVSAYLGLVSAVYHLELTSISY